MRLGRATPDRPIIRKGAVVGTWASDGAAAGLSTVTGAGNTIIGAIGTAGGLGSATGVGSATFSAAGSSTGTSTVPGVSLATAAATGSASGLGAASGAGNAIAAATGSAAGTSDAPGASPGGVTISAVGSARGGARLPFSPSVIAGLVHWIDVADNATITQSAGKVSAIANKGSVGGSITQATPSKQFTLTTTVNGQALQCAAPGPLLVGDTNAAYDLRDMTVCGVARYPVEGAAHLISRSNDQSLDGWYVNWGYHFQTDQNQATVAFSQIDVDNGYATTSINFSGYTIDTSRTYQCTFRRDPTTVGGSLTGSGFSSIGVSTYVVPIGAYKLVLGGGDRSDTGPTGTFQGEIYETLLYNQPLIVADIQRIEGYFAWKWGLVADLPGAHPYKSAPPADTDSAALGVGMALMQGVGSATGTGTASAAGRSIALFAGSSVGQATVTATGVANAAGIASSSGASTVLATGVGLAAGAGNASGAGTVSAVANALGAGVGSSTGFGNANAGATAITARAGSAAGSGVASGVGVSVAAGAGNSSGVALAAAAGVRLRETTANAGGGAAANGVGQPIVAATGQASGSATVIGALGSTVVVALTGVQAVGLVGNASVLWSGIIMPPDGGWTPGAPGVVPPWVVIDPAGAGAWRPVVV
jgi:hypothetical protein